MSDHPKRARREVGNSDETTSHHTPSHSTSRAQSSDHDESRESVVTATSQETETTHTVADPALEQHMNFLNLDEDLKANIRSMSPNTRREVLNDIVRERRTNLAANVLAPELRANADLDGHYTAPDDAAEHESRGLGLEDYNDIVTIVMGLNPGMMQYAMRGGTAARNDDDDDDDEHDTEEEAEEDEDDDSSGEQVREGGLGHNRLRPTMIRLSGDNFASLLLGGAHMRQEEQRRLTDHIRNLVARLHQSAMLASMNIHRDVDDMSYEELLALEERIGDVSKGLTFGQGLSSTEPLEHEPTEGRCAVCQEEWPTHVGSDGATNTNTSPSHHDTGTGEAPRCVRIKVCGHVFHERCIFEWFQHHKTCPVCTREVLPS